MKRILLNGKAALYDLSADQVAELPKQYRLMTTERLGIVCALDPRNGDEIELNWRDPTSSDVIGFFATPTA